MIENNEYFEEYFDGLKLGNMDLSGKVFTNCCFSSCDFHKTNLLSCRFETCTFIDCALVLPNIIDAQFDSITFKNCKLTGLNFEKLNQFLISFNFINCKLQACSFVKLHLPQSKFTKSAIFDSLFSETQLSKSDFSDVVFSQTQFIQCNLEGANFRGASGFFIAPHKNRIRQAKFDSVNAFELLECFDIRIK